MENQLFTRTTYLAFGGRGVYSLWSYFLAANFPTIRAARYLVRETMNLARPTVIDQIEIYSSLELGTISLVLLRLRQILVLVWSSENRWYS